MVFKETSVFTKRLAQLFTDEEYRLLQTRLIQDPGAGSVIQGSGGIRKIRWKAEGSGKHLSQAQLHQLANLVRKEYP